MTIDEPAILIRINRLYRDGMSKEELFEVTRGVWRVGERRQKPQYAFAVHKGIVREVYRIRRWVRAGTTPYRFRSRAAVEAPDRWEIEGEVAESEIRDKYVNKSVEQYFTPNARNPITYVNC